MSDIVERLRVGEPCAGGPDECCDKKASSGCLCAEAADSITRLTAEVERLKVESIQMQAALGYPIFAEDERHISPLNPYRCGVCDANKHIIAEVERLRAALQWQPIETAPMDGTLVLTYWPGNLVRNPVTIVNERNSGHDLGVRGSWWHSRPTEQPTHWLPLPPPPSQEKSDDQG